MNTKRFTLAALMAIVFASGLLAGCGGKEPEPGKNDAPDVKEMRKDKSGGE